MFLLKITTGFSATKLVTAAIGCNKQKEVGNVIVFVSECWCFAVNSLSCNEGLFIILLWKALLWAWGCIVRPEEYNVQKNKVIGFFEINLHDYLIKTFGSLGK